MRYIQILLLLVTLISCKKNNVITQKESSQQIIAKKNVTDLTLFVRSTSFNFKTKKENVFSSLDHIDNNIALAKAYIKTDGTGTLGWIQIDFKKNKVYDITLDPKNPIVLKYNKKLYQDIKNKYYSKHDNDTFNSQNEIVKNDNIITENNYKKILNSNTFTKTNKPINIEGYLCDKEYPLKYYTLSQSQEYTNILFEEICGDFNVTNLIILKKNKIVSNLAIETEWFEPESYKEYHEKTTFKIIKKKIKLQKQTFENEKIKSTTTKTYKITDKGKIEEIK